MFKNYNEIETFNEEVLEPNTANDGGYDECMEEDVPAPELEETAELEAQETETETETESDLVIGVVTNCIRLNVREEPNVSAPIITEVDALSELMVDVVKSDEEWYSVCTEAGIEGFCMKKFVDIKQ